MAESVVVDTSVFVAALKSKSGGGSREILRHCLRGDLEPMMGHKLFMEYLDVFERPGLLDSSPATRSEREALFHGFLSVCRWVRVFFLWRPNLPDENDNHVLELAVAGGAEVLITHNVVDFKGELIFPALRVVTPAHFLQMKGDLWRR